MVLRDVTLTLADGKAITLAMPEPGTGRSIFLLSLPKAGSTLFYRIMKPICDRANVPFYSLPNELNRMGMPLDEVVDGLQHVFVPCGYAYGGFRGFDRHLTLPEYADDASVLLVRDPRDMLTSLYFSEAKSHVPPGTAAGDKLLQRFEDRRKRAQELSIDEFVLQRSAGLAASYQSIFDALGTKRYRLFRYEDVIFEKEKWVFEMLEYLKLDVPLPLIKKVVERNDIRPAAEDQEQHIRKVAPGDHAEKLAPATIATLERDLAPLMKKLGYSCNEDNSLAMSESGTE